MVLPLWDENPFKAEKKPVVTWALIALNVLIFLTQTAAPGDAVTALAIGFGATPAAVLHLDPLAGAMQQAGSGGWLWPQLTLITSMFLHGDVFHLLGNMLFLFVFGDNIEHTLGRGRFLLFYLLCGVGAALAYIITGPYSTAPLIGASGAIAGVFAAYAMIRPCAKVTVFVYRIVLRLKAFWVIGGWILWQLIQIAMQSGDQPGDQVAYSAHIGGLLVGAVLLVLIKGPDVVLFECLDHEQTEQIAQDAR